MTRLLFLLLYSNSVFAIGWNDSLRSLSKVNSETSCTTPTTQRDEICSNPYPVICGRPRPEPKAEKKKLLKQFNEAMGANVLKNTFQQVTAANAKLKEIEELYLDAWLKFRKPLDAVGMPWQEVEKKANNDSQLKILKAPIEEQKGKIRELEKKYFTLTEQLVQTLLKRYGRTPQDLHTLFADVKKSVLTTASQSFPPSPKDPSVAKREDLIQALENTQIVMSYAAGSPDESAFKGFTSTCGEDGLEINAFYDRQRDFVQICPGMLLNALAYSNGSLESLYGTLAHELGHASDGHSLSVPCQTGTCKFEYPYVYQKFWDCIQQRYASDPSQNFLSEADIVEQLKDKIPELKQKLATLKEPQYSIAIEMIQFSVSLSQEQKASSDKIKNIRAELAADFFFSSAIADKLQKVPFERRVDFISKSYPTVFCEDHSKESIFDQVRSSLQNTHPPTRFRIENTLRNPKIRELLGCSPLLPEDQPWCDLQ